MPTGSTPRDDHGGPTLSIGDLARATGVSAATLRMWETRYGFPRPRRLASGHRRYSPADAEAVDGVRRRRDSGVRLEVAIQQVAAAAATPLRPAIFARIAEAHPEQPRQRLTKSTLLGISHAIEDAVVATAQPAHMFAAFQTADYYEAARDRWEEIARVTASAHVFGQFQDVPGADESGSGPVRVSIPGNAPMLREWALVCDAPALPVAMLAWEPPGQTVVPDRDRVFEVMWTVDPQVVRTAARWCADAAATVGSSRAVELVAGPLATSPTSRPPTPLATAWLVMRIFGHLDTDRRG